MCVKKVTYIWVISFPQTMQAKLGSQHTHGLTDGYTSCFKMIPVQIGSLGCIIHHLSWRRSAPKGESGFGESVSDGSISQYIFTLPSDLVSGFAVKLAKHKPDSLVWSSLPHTRVAREHWIDAFAIGYSNPDSSEWMIAPKKYSLFWHYRSIAF